MSIAPRNTPPARDPSTFSASWVAFHTTVGQRALAGLEAGREALQDGLVQSLAKQARQRCPERINAPAWMHIVIDKYGHLHNAIIAQFLAREPHAQVVLRTCGRILDIVGTGPSQNGGRLDGHVLIPAQDEPWNGTQFSESLAVGRPLGRPID